jgi:sigma-54-specific transcriptional regulator
MSAAKPSKDTRVLALLGEVARVARSDAAVLISGEPGVGKEIFARAIHTQSGRTGPFVAVNCGAIADSLAEAEFFGYRPGAFTGALEARRGWFETANEGTLFLDEVSELPLDVQAKLLRVLQEHEVVPLGSPQAIPLDIRIVAATNIELHYAIDAGRFRPDLFYRLGVVRIRVPPLRSRRADIIPFALHFIEQHCERIGMPAPTLARDARRLLLGNLWCGNIRELDNVVHAALLSCGGSELRAEHFTIRNLNSAATREHSSHLVSELEAQLELLFREPSGGLFDSVLATIVKQALVHCEFNQVHAAQILGISRYRLRRLVQRFKLEYRSDGISHPAGLETQHGSSTAADSTSGRE